MIAQNPAADNLEILRAHVDQLFDLVRSAARNGTPAHRVELSIWLILLALGRSAFGQFLDLLGSGDLGPTVELPDASTATRLPELHSRRYVSIFGLFQLLRTVYGSREGQKIDFVPLDNRLELPESDFSYLLQDWDQSLCVEQAFAQVKGTIARILGLNQSVDSLERMNADMAEPVASFRDNQPAPEPATEAEIVVSQADGKGIVLRRPPEAPAPKAHRTKGQKASLKRMALVGAVYTIASFVRLPEQVVAALFGDRSEAARPKRPVPCHKRVWASLTHVDERTGRLKSGQDFIYEWLQNEVIERNRDLSKEMVYLHDGQESLWQACHDYLPRKNATEILDILHVTPRLWQAAHVFEKEGSGAAEQRVRDDLLRVLRGEVAAVLRDWRRRAGQAKLSGAKKRTLAKVSAYLEKNAGRMKYGEYLAKGYPIASGVIEGACRHLVKDRMERAGMHWREAGAQAMLDVRSVAVNGQWEAYQEYRIERETRRLYPHREMVEGVTFPLAA
jgi:hypothetical protein